MCLLDLGYVTTAMCITDRCLAKGGSGRQDSRL